MSVLFLVGVTAAGVPAVSECTWSAASPCKVTCPKYTFDLSGFKAQEPNHYLYAIDDSFHTYYFGGCETLQGVTCEGSTIASPAAIQTWGGNPPVVPSDSCAAVGDFTTRECHSPNNQTLICDHSRGDQGRSVSFEYKYAPTAYRYAASQPDPSSLHYNIQLEGPAARSKPKPPPPPPTPTPPTPAPTTCGLPASPTVFSDMHDGDKKKVALAQQAGALSLTITPYSSAEFWSVKATLDPKQCNATVDFRVAGKPNPPPVALTALFSSYTDPSAPTAALKYKSLVVFTDPSGTIAPAAAPLNAWIG